MRIDGEQLKVTKTKDTYKIVGENILEGGHSAGTTVIVNFSLTAKYDGTGFKEIIEMNATQDWKGITDTSFRIKTRNIKWDPECKAKSKYSWIGFESDGLIIDDFGLVYNDKPVSYTYKKDSKNYISVDIELK